MASGLDLADDWTGMNINKATINVLQMGVGFFFVFFAFNSQGFIEEPVLASAAANNHSINTHAGYYSMSIIYGAFTLGNFAAAPLADFLTPKWAMVLGVSLHALFQVGFLFLNEIYLYTSSALLGLGAAGMNINKATINVLQMGVGFFFVFFAFNSQGFIEEPVLASAAANNHSINTHAGYYSMSIIYGAFTLGNFAAAPLADFLTPKWAMVLGVSLHALFQVGFLFLNEIYLYTSSALLGLGAAVLWTGQGSYLSRNCTEETTSRNIGLFWALQQSSLAVGGLFLFLVFHTSDTTDNIAESTVRILYSTFTALTILGAIVLFFLRAPPELGKVPQPKVNVVQSLVATFKLMTTKKILLLIPVFAYTGIELSFWSGIYPTCISFTQQLGSNTNALLAINMICSGMGQITAGVLFGILGDRTRKIGRGSIVFLGCGLHLMVFAMVYGNFPSGASLHKTQETGGLFAPSVTIALICGGLLGFGDACWNTQIYSILCELYPIKSSQVFACFKFWQSLLSSASFFYSSKISLLWNLCILALTSMVAAVCFFVTEKISRKQKEEEMEVPKYTAK